MRLRVEKSAMAYSGKRKNRPKITQRAARSTRFHRNHRAVRRTRRLYATITTATTTIISSASAYANPDWPSTTSLVNAERISSGTIGLPWLTNAAAVA